MQRRILLCICLTMGINKVYIHLFVLLYYIITPWRVEVKPEYRPGQPAAPVWFHAALTFISKFVFFFFLMCVFPSPEFNAVFSSNAHVRLKLTARRPTAAIGKILGGPLLDINI